MSLDLTDFKQSIRNLKKEDKMALRGQLYILFFLFFLSAPSLSHAGYPEVKNLMVTDVTTVSFSAVWTASEASTAGLEVFGDADGTVAVATAVIIPHPVQNGDASIGEAAEDNGVMKIMVTGLEADTTYYFRTLTTSKSTIETTIDPVAELVPVTTEILTTRTYTSGTDILPFSNDIITEPCYLADGTTPAEGTLLVATVAGGHHPITAFVGDGVELPYALIDLNNVFGRETSETLDLTGGSNLTLVNVRGLAGTSMVTHQVPVDDSLAEIKTSDFFLKTGWNFISVQIIPDSTDLQSVLSEIWDDVASVWTYDTLSDHWSRYDKNNPFPWLNDLSSFEFGKGYWIQALQDCSLKVKGTLPESEQIQLNTGWNQVGYRSIETMPLSDATASIDAFYQSIWTYNTLDDQWLRYDKNNPFPWLNNLEDISPGHAYWIEVTEDTLW